MGAEAARLRIVGRLSLLGVALTFGVVLLGAWTRLVDAGLGCPDWPGCYGQLVVPNGETALTHTPGLPFEAGKAWMEMIHRYVATGLGGLVLVLVLQAWRLRRIADYPWRITLLLLAAILLQGAFGAFTVTLKLWPQVVTLHLLGGLSVMVLFLWLHLRLRQVGRGGLERPRFSQLNVLSIAAILLLLAQLALGGWTTSNYAGLACQGFPTCNAQWWPPMDWSEGFHLTQTIGPNYLHGQLHAQARTAIHMMHRMGALGLGVILLMLAWRYRRCLSLKPYLIALLGTYGLQATLGVANVLLWLPLGMALAHTAGAALLTLTMALTVWRLTSLPREADKRQGVIEEMAHA